MIFRIIIILFLSYLLIGFIIVLLGKSFDIDNADYLIVLGHKLENDKPDEVLKNRLRKALRYIDENENCKIVLSGGITKGNTISEAQVMKTYLNKNGINDSKIIMEDKSIDTIENIRNCKEYIDTSSKVVVLSSSYHTFRARMICNMCGLKVKTIEAHTPIIDFIKHIVIEILYIPIHYKRLKELS